jgi:hypothetical protein
MQEKSTKMYYILSDKLEKPKFDAYIDAALLDFHGEVTPNIFNKGEAVAASKNLKYFLEINDQDSLPGKMRDRLAVLIHNSDYIFLASERLQNLLKETSNYQIEFIPISFEYGGVGYDNYKIVNVLKKVECIDYELSEITFESYDEDDEPEGDIYAIEGLILDESLIPADLNIFLLARTKSSIIIVHERLKNILIQQGMSGFIFYKPENFQL